MYTDTTKRPMSFNIDDILTFDDKKNRKKDINSKYIPNDYNSEINNNAKNVFNNEDSAVKNRVDFNVDQLLRKTLLFYSDDNNKLGIYPEDLSSKSCDIERRKSALGHNEKSSAFKGVESFGGRKLGSCSTSSSNGFSRDPYGTPHANGVSLQSHQWTIDHNIFPPLYNYPTHPLTSYSSYYPSPMLRPYPLSLPIPFPLPYNKRKGGQVRFTPQQTQNLERRFGSHQYLSPEDRRILAEQLKLTDRQVKTWFQNRRAKWRRAKSTTSSNTSVTRVLNSDEEAFSDSSESSMFKSPRNSPILVG